MGKVTTQDLARKGATIIGIGCDPTCSEETCTDIQEVSGKPKVEFLLADLSDQAQVRRLAREIKAKYVHLDVLINNAGAFFLHRTFSLDGIEMTWR